MGFAEQLAAKAAEAKSHRERSDASVSSLGSGRNKIRKPRIRPVDDARFGSDDERDEAGEVAERRERRTIASFGGAGSLAVRPKRRAGGAEGLGGGEDGSGAGDAVSPTQQTSASNSQTATDCESVVSSNASDEKQAQMQQFLQQIDNLRKVDLDRQKKMHYHLRAQPNPSTENGEPIGQPDASADSACAMDEDDVISDAWARMSRCALKPPRQNNKSSGEAEHRQSAPPFSNPSPSLPVRATDVNDRQFSPLTKQILRKHSAKEVSHDAGASAAVGPTVSCKPQSPDNNNIKPVSPNNNNANGSKQPDETPVPHNTHAIFGAWAQIESLQLRLKEAEARADAERRRAELAESRGRGFGGGGFGGGVGRSAASANGVEGGDSSLTVGGDDGNKAGVQHVFTKQKRSLSGSSGSSAANNRKFKAKESAESLETVALVVDEDRHPILPAPNTSCETTTPQHKSAIDVNAIATTTNELNEWKRRALEAEDRLSKHNYSVLVSPQASATNNNSSSSNPFQSAPKPNPAIESDLIQLKNAEIEVLRHQISSLELRIREERRRNADAAAYRNHLHHLDPPIAVAECTATAGGGNSSSAREYEFRMLRDEIRHLQYQLSRKNNAATSAQSTTGSTLSSLENENEEEEEGGEVVRASGWGYMCCARRNRRGYGRVTR